MFKKNKQLITGFILGAIVFGTMPVQAKVQEYLLQKSTAKVMVDGKEFANEDLPVLNYKNSNYIPMATFREICNNIGVGFEWVGESSEVRINTGRNIKEQSTKETAQTVEENKGSTITKIENNGSIITEIEKDGYKLLVIGGVEYIHLVEAAVKHKDQGYSLNYIPELEELYFYYTSDSRDRSKDEILLRNVKFQTFEGSSYMEYSYFKDNILAFIQKQ